MHAFAASKPRPALSRLGQDDGGMADSKRLFKIAFMIYVTE